MLAERRRAANAALGLRYASSPPISGGPAVKMATARDFAARERRPTAKCRKTLDLLRPVVGGGAVLRGGAARTIGWWGGGMGLGPPLPPPDNLAAMEYRAVSRMDVNRAIIPAIAGRRESLASAEP